MIQQLKNSQRLSLFLAMIFFLAVLVSAYMLYSLPSEVIETAGYGPALNKTYLTIGITFIVGAIAIYYSIISKKEMVVFKEKAVDQGLGDASNGSGSKNAISLETVKASLVGEKTTDEIFKDFLSAVCKTLDAGQGALYEAEESDGKRKVVLTSGYALNMGESASLEYEFGEGLIGQAALESRTLYVDEIPEGYIKIISGLGSASPRFLLIVPVKGKNAVVAVIEIASFTDLSEEKRKFVEEAAQLLEKTIVK
jgi:methyl-accepting chemotaxis protein